MALEFFRYFLVLLVPGVIGALAFSITARLKTEVNIWVALMLDLLIFTTMLCGLYYCKHVYKFSDLLNEFTCLHFTTVYVCISVWVGIVYGVIFGFIRRLFFWIRR